MRSTMFRSAVALAGGLALAGASLTADGRSGAWHASSSAGASPSAGAASRGSASGGSRASAPAARASAPAARSRAPVSRAPSAGAPRTRFASDQGSPRTAPAGSEPVGTAVSRGGDSGGSWGGSSPTPSSAGGTETIQSTSGGHDRRASSGSSSRGKAVSGGGRSRGDRTAIGTAEPRPPYGGGGGGSWGPGYGWDYSDYYWGYGAVGLGYFYYDPFWMGSGWADPWGAGYYGGSGGYSVRQDAIGQLRLKVKPKEAQVYVDGALAGKVDDFDGTFERLDLSEGPHRVELRLEGRTPLTFDVNIIADELVTYRGQLQEK
jgi:hypothetical protein